MFILTISTSKSVEDRTTWISPSLIHIATLCLSILNRWATTVAGCPVALCLTMSTLYHNPSFRQAFFWRFSRTFDPAAVSLREPSIFMYPFWSRKISASRWSEERLIPVMADSILSEQSPRSLRARRIWISVLLRPDALIPILLQRSVHSLTPLSKIGYCFCIRTIRIGNPNFHIGRCYKIFR